MVQVRLPFSDGFRWPSDGHMSPPDVENHAHCALTSRSEGVRLQHGNSADFLCRKSSLACK